MVIWIRLCPAGRQTDQLRLFDKAMQQELQEPIHLEEHSRGTLSFQQRRPGTPRAILSCGYSEVCREEEDRSEGASMMSTMHSLWAPNTHTE